MKFIRFLTFILLAALFLVPLYGQVPGFTQNKGQIIDQNGNPRPDILYLLDYQGFRLHLRKNAFSYELYKKLDAESLLDEATGEWTATDESLSKWAWHRVDVSLEGANLSPRVNAQFPFSDYENFYTYKTPEEGITQVRRFNKIVYHDIWPQIDLVFYLTETQQLKYDFVIHPGGKPSNIRLVYKGADELCLDGEGKLQLETSLGLIQEQAPIAYSGTQEEGQKEIAIQFVLKENKLRFNPGKYDKNKALIIDPQLVWGTYYGPYSGNLSGTLGPIAGDLDIDQSGNLLLVESGTSPIFASSGAFKDTVTGNWEDMVIAKIYAGRPAYLGGLSMGEMRERQDME